MRKKLFFGIFIIVLMVANLFQISQGIQGNFTFNELLNVAIAESEIGGGTQCSTKIEINDVRIQGCPGNTTNVFGYNIGSCVCIGDIGAGGGCYYGSWNLTFTCASAIGTGTDTRKWKDCY